MEVHESPEDYFKKKFQDPKWLAFQNQFDDFHNKAYINKSFYAEHRSCTKNYRCNKKNPTKCQSYFQCKKKTAKADCCAQKATDSVYETAIPNTLTYACDGLGSRVYNCKFTSDGEKILVTTQCGTSFFKINSQNKLEHSSVILCDNVRWAITDSQLSSNNRFMIHVTISQYAHMFDLEKGDYVKEFNLDKQQDGKSVQTCIDKMKVYGLDISGDNKEIIVGCNKLKEGGLVKTFDLERELTKVNNFGHKEDVNSVCYLNKDSASILLSASDDGTCKLWDSRVNMSNGPAGVFYGHVSGLTCVQSKEDNRYFITNSKDQSLKLWDIRKFAPQRKTYNFFKYDYRHEILTPDHIEEIKCHQKSLDNSVMTFWGHQVHLTLIRCRFSPLHGTAQRYVYSGSYDGRVYIYDTLTGENVVTLELPKEDDNVFQGPVVRDCAWHPHSQTLVNTSFHGSVCRWEYMDLRDGEKVEEEEMEVEGEGEGEDSKEVKPNSEQDRYPLLCYNANNSVNCNKNNTNF